MKIGVILDSRANANELAELGRLAEKNGLGSIWTSSLLDSRDPFINFSIAAANTEKIRLGPIAVNPYDIHPVRITTSLLTLNEMCQGRAHIVIGGGGEALEALGIEPKRRVGAVKECVQIIKGASPDTPLNYQGSLYQVKGYHPFWVEADAPKVYVGANMPQMLTMSAREADGIMLSDLTPPLIREAIQTAQQGLATRAVPKEDFGFNNFFAWHVYQDKDEGVKEARQWLALRGLFRRWVITTFLSDQDYDLIESKFSAFFNALAQRTHVIEGVPDRILDQLVDNLTFTGHVSDIDHVIDRLQEFKAAGLTEIALRLYQKPAESIRLIGEKVVPALA